MSTPTNEREAEIRARLAAATPGPWESEFLDEDGAHRVLMLQPTDTRYHYETHRVWECNHDLYEPDETSDKHEVAQWNEAAANADLIANAPTDLSWALSRIEELAKDKAALSDGTVWHHTKWSSNAGWYHKIGAAGMGGPFASADEALAAFRASSSGANTP